MKLRRLLDEKDGESFTSEEYMNLYTYVFVFDDDETFLVAREICFARGFAID
jgi:hypothetical protein